MIGPKSAPILPVPRRCAANSSSKTSTDIGTMNGCAALVQTSMPFYRRNHRYRGRNRAVAVQHRRPEEHEQGEGPQTQRRRCALWRHQLRQQRERAALSVIVGAQHEANVLHADDDDERPKDQRKNAQRRSTCDGSGKLTGKALLERIERAGSDVAEDHAQRRKRKRGDRLGAWRRARTGSPALGSSVTCNGHDDLRPAQVPLAQFVDDDGKQNHCA